MVATAYWTILSSRAATPSGRCRPSSFCMYTLLEGNARYAPRWTRPCRSINRSSTPVSYSCQVTPSTPGAAFFFNEWKLSRSRSTVRWWSKAVNFISLCSLAAFRTPANPWDTPFPLCVGYVLDRPAFSLISGLPSPLSADGLVSLFAWFIGTIPLCDSSETCTRAVWPEPSPADLPSLFFFWIAGVSEVSRFSCLKFLGVPWGLRPRRTEPELALSLSSVLPSAHINRVGVRVVCFRSSIAHPAYPLSTLRCVPRGSSARLEAKWFAIPFL